ncbi:hypothetical protein [Streptomyces hoynatensis]|uniref:Uncharacterized protein n=1 Tax=Streptomyces hoynatensis TaxID=1141874 RepID=A0A3A9ZCD6_9ACTN|nr:hypothetical protein [Streptomyces hoynatensis]RKN45779.1 hypothetical protein D7294_04810 [Streptomyces hoynatensis]
MSGTLGIPGALGALALLTGCGSTLPETPQPPPPAGAEPSDAPSEGWGGELGPSAEVGLSGLPPEEPLPPWRHGEEETYPGCPPEVTAEAHDGVVLCAYLTTD